VQTNRNLRDRIRWDVRRLYHQARKVLLRLRIGERWEEAGPISRRIYPDYNSYVEHQKTKFSAQRSKRVMAHDQTFHDALADRLTRLPHELGGRSVLCLGARQGTEVRCFIERGAFAVGIDLNPGPGNRHVVVGDFHALQFADGSIDVVYTNSLDHAFDLDRILAEVSRVLRPGGLFIVEANAADDGSASAGPYEAMAWESPGALADRIATGGFERLGSTPFALPWPGEQLRFEREQASA
jgi:SAM-dependent methyltransferase